VGRGSSTPSKSPQEGRAGTHQRPFLGRLGPFQREGRETHHWNGDRSWARISSPISVAAVARMVADLNTPAAPGGSVATWPRLLPPLPPSRVGIPEIGRRRRVWWRGTGSTWVRQNAAASPRSVGKQNERSSLRHSGLAHAVHDALVLLEVGRIIARGGEFKTANGERGIKPQSGVGFSLRLP
jgi:hypothetical protein